MGVLSGLAVPLAPLLQVTTKLSTPVLCIVGFSTFFVLAVVINVLQQLLLKDPAKPPVVFHYVPWFGSAATYGMDPYAFFFGCQEKYGNYYTFVMFGRKMTVCLGPQGNDFVFNGKLSDVCAEDAYTHLTTPVFGEGVVYDCPNHRLMEQKKFMKFGLTTETFKRYVPLIVEQLQNYFASHPSFKGSKGTTSLAEIIPQITIFTASRTLQGKEVRDGLDGSFARAMHDLDLGFNPMNFLFPHIPTPGNFRRDRAHNKVAQFYLDVIGKRRKEKSDGVEEKTDMLWNLMDRKYKDGTPVSDRHVAHMMIALLMAGQHTSMATSMWMLLHLAQRPDVVAELYEEQLKVCGRELRPLTYEDQQQLTLHTGVIKEVLRLHPPLHSIIRKVKSPMQTRDSNYIIPSGHYVMACPGVAALDSRYFKNPTEFDPRRWEGQVQVEDTEQFDFGFGLVSKGTGSPYLPFGAGRHRCIGEQFAYVQLGTILATWVREYELALPDGKTELPPPDYTSMITMPTPPAIIAWKKRNP